MCRAAAHLLLFDVVERGRGNAYDNSSNSSFLANTSIAIAWVALEEALMRPAIDMS